MASFLQPLLRQENERHIIVNERTGQVVADQLLVAFDSQSRRQGLLKHTSLPESTAMVIAPSNAVHTFFMKFPIDIAFVSKSGRVLKVRSSVPAWRMSGALRGFAVLEMAAGSLERSGTTAGDQLVIREAK